MRLAIGLGVAVVGLILLIMGINESDSLASGFSKFFTGNPTDRSMWLMIGGIAALVIGLGSAFVPMGWKKA